MMPPESITAPVFASAPVSASVPATAPAPAASLAAGPCRPIIVCPLEFERAALHHHGVDRLAELSCCGPGVAGIERWWSGRSPTRQPIILAGLAGSLHESFANGCAWWVSAVVESRDAPGLSPTLFVPASRCVVTSARGAVVDRGMKRSLRATTGADLVDLESIAFARSATQAGASWAIVRGVSDDVDARLPAGIDRWVDARGRTRIMPAMWDVLRRPTNVRVMWNLKRDGDLALAEVARLLHEFFRQTPA